MFLRQKYSIASIEARVLELEREANCIGLEQRSRNRNGRASLNAEAAESAERTQRSYGLVAA